MNATPHADDPQEAARLHAALRAHLRQDFVAPAAAIVGFADILLDDSGRLGLSAFAADLERIKTAGQSLQRLLNEVLSQSEGPPDTDAYRTRLRHDLRTPINAVKGYGEMILEDAEAGGHDALLPDLRKLLAAAEDLLARVDALVAFSGQDGTRTALAMDGAARVVAAMKTAAPAPSAGAMTGCILVVDDNESNRDLLARQLARDGHAVETAASAAQAFARLAERGFDLILLDVLMPDVSGYDVLLRLKSDARTAEIPVIMISALDELESIVRCIEAGAVDYLPKPFAPPLLRARIRASLENKFLHDREREMMREIRVAKERNEALLLSILPKPVVDRINGGASMVADHISEATILFADLVDFTPFSAGLPAADVVGFLNLIFSEFDRLADRFGAEKIKTIGDAYMVAVGIPEPRRDHAEACARLALAMREALQAIKAQTGAPVRLRIGLHAGPAIAGVIGERKFAYDVWGSTVNIASRMESHGLPDRIHVSKTVAQRLDGKFLLSPRGPLEVKGAGLMETFFLDGENEAGSPSR
jgi:class 3 adenylate cyclase